MNKIALSFFPLETKSFEFTVYRKSYNGEKYLVDSEHKRRKLPDLPNNKDNYKEYWVSFEPDQGFEEFTCDTLTNYQVTLDLLHKQLLSQCYASLQASDFILPKGLRKRQIYFVLNAHKEGKQVVWLEPYYVKTVGNFGFLVDYKFYTPAFTKATRTVQQLSLSLDKNGQSNRNYYSDKFEKLQYFIKLYFTKLFPLKLNTLDISIKRDLLNLDSMTLSPKEYIFGNGKTSISQFNGIKGNGPLSIPTDAKLYFIYREKDKPFSHDLYKALRGDTFNSTFPGMQEMFGYELSKETVSGIPIEDFTLDEINKIITSMKNDAVEKKPVPIILAPFSKDDVHEKGSNEYYLLKHALLKHHIPSQFVSLRKLQIKEQFKWAISNIGLQIFAKMGGQPWKVKPKTDNCLIIGIGQAHKKTKGIIEKYFAYSVLTESTGLYRDLKILGHSTHFSEYLSKLEENLEAILKDHINNYDTFVLHATFAIKQEELNTIQNILDRLSDRQKKFVVMRFNDHNKYFGYSLNNNSLVPYESSYIKLSESEYLVWFEGLQYQNPNIRKKIERPMYVEFLYPQKALTPEEMISYLQDAVNISGTNWRGFNAKSLPVSIFYAYLVADFYKEFEAEKLEEIDLEAINPWFL